MVIDSGVMDADSETQDAGVRPVGPGADGTFQIGARRTFRSSPTRTWDLIASPEGATAWLGDTPTEWWSRSDGDGDGPIAGSILETAGGEAYEVRSVTAGARIRLRTLGPRLPRTTIQLTLVGERGRATIGLHQEGLPDDSMREPIREHWMRALDRLEVLLDEGRSSR